MGDDSPPQQPAAPPPPAAPDYAAANREAIQADIETLPTRKRVEAAAKLGRVVYDPDTGKTYDFTGLGESELALEQARINAQTADLGAASVLDVQRKYGADFTSEALKRIQEADPTGFQARRELAQQTLDDLRLGSSLSADEENRFEQQIRGGQAARGNILGSAATSEEVLGKTEFGQKLKQQRLSNVASYVMGTPLTAQYQNLSAAQNQTAPYAPVAYQPGTGLNPNAGALGAQFAAGLYGQQMGAYGSQLGYMSSGYNTQMANTTNPWMTGLGMLTGAGTSLGSAALTCWVAEELWGKDSPNVSTVRAFVKAHLEDKGELGRFLREYQEHGRTWSIVIRYNQGLRMRASRLWLELLELANGETSGPSDADLAAWLNLIKPMEA